MMKRAVRAVESAAVLFFAAFVMLPLAAFPIELDYVKGKVSYCHLKGEWVEAKTGVELVPGDIIRTGEGSEASLIDEGLEIKLLENSTFTVSERYENEERKQGFMLFLGRMKCKIVRSGRAEPEVSTQAVSLTIRGTDFEVGSGFDGSAIVLLSDGRVAVAGPGRELVLEGGEGTEVPFGEDPAQKFQVMTKVVEWKGWFEQSKQAVKGNEPELLRRILARFEVIRDDIRRYEEIRASSLKESEELIDRRNELIEEGKKDEATEYSRKAAGKSRIAFHSLVNIRFLALSSIGLFDLANGIYSGVKQPPREMADSFERIKSIYGGIERAYILEGDREKLEKKSKKKR